MRLFDETTLRKLEQLTLSADSVRVGVMKGERRSRKRGSSIEFSDYRDYTQGDDLRRFDWNVYARLERPFIKLSQEEEDLAVHLLVDASASMNWPRGEDIKTLAANKLRFAMQLAGGLGYIGLISGDLVHATLFDSAARRAWGPFRGRQNGWPLVQFLEANYDALMDAPGARKAGTTLGLSLRDYALRARRPGLLLLLSDLYSLDDYRAGLSALMSRGYEIALLHVLSRDEIDPGLSGDLKLVDVETGESAEVSIDPAVLEDYATRLRAWQDDIRDYCGARGIHYQAVITDSGWDEVLLQGLRRQGVVR
jgi:uncharacterized protein (DUF58 family)